MRKFEAMIDMGGRVRYVIVEGANISQAYSAAVLLCERGEVVRGVNEVNESVRVGPSYRTEDS